MLNTSGEHWTFGAEAMFEGFNLNHPPTHPYPLLIENLTQFCDYKIKNRFPKFLH